MELSKAVWMYALGQLLSDDLPAVAVQAIEDGYESPALYQLAGALAPDAQEARTLFLRALGELRMAVPSPREAALASARAIASDVLHGVVAPYAGAKRIWSDLYTRISEVEELRLFVGLASEYEDDQNHREEYSRRIVEECKKLLSK